MRSPSVIVSALAHATAIGIAIIAPLVASDVLPAIQNPISPYVRAFRAADIPLTQPATPRTRVTHAGAPTAAPAGIMPEKPQPPEHEGPIVPFGTEDLTITGLPAEFGTRETISPVPPPPPPNVPPSPAVTRPVDVGGHIKAPARLAAVTPTYPPVALSARIEGTVVLEAIIGMDGSVQELRVVRSVPLLDEAALGAVRQWHYTPTLLNGVPVPVRMTVTVSFRLTR